MYYIIRNRWLVILKNYSSLRTLVCLGPLLLFYDLAQLAVALERMAGRVAACLRLDGEKRACGSAGAAPIQKLRRVPDREILVGGPIPFRAELTTGAMGRLARRLLSRCHCFIVLAARRPAKLTVNPCPFKH